MRLKKLTKGTSIKVLAFALIFFNILISLVIASNLILTVPDSENLADARIYSLSPNTNYGASNLLVCGPNHRIYISFNLSRSFLPARTGVAENPIIGTLLFLQSNKNS